MLLCTDQGHYFTVVEDFDDPEVIWVRSQDLRSITHAAITLEELVPIPTEKASYEVIDQPDWDYQYRLKLTRPLWSLYLQTVTQDLRCHKLKPAVAEARGYDHPIARMVNGVFMFMSRNRSDGSLPEWLR